MSEVDFSSTFDELGIETVQGVRMAEWNMWKMNVTCQHPDGGIISGTGRGETFADALQAAVTELQRRKAK